MIDKIKNPYFIAGIISTILLAGGFEFETLTSWSLLIDALRSIIENPVTIVSCICSVYAMFNDNSKSFKINKK